MNPARTTSAATVPMLGGMCLYQLLVPWVDLNPLHWLGDAAKQGAADAFTAMMMALWSGALWLLATVFRLLDNFTTPNVADPSLSHLYAITLWVSAFFAVLIGLGQVAVAAARRDGRSLGTLVVGLVQYGAVVIGWLVVCAGLVTACGGLTSGLLHALLGVDGFAGYPAGAGLVDQATGTVQATVLGLCALFMLIPAAFGYLLIMLVREAGLLVLVATMPIAAAGALAEGTRAWLWKSLRWFLAACLTAPLLALVLGIGVQIAHIGLDTGPGVAGAMAQQAAAHPTSGTVLATVSSTPTHIGMAVVGSALMLVSCFCPMALFRLLAFVDPGTASGASFRSTLVANGGVAGLVSGRRGAAGEGSGAATQLAGDGRSASEDAADAATADRFQAKLARVVPVLGGAVAGGMGKVAGVAAHGAALGVDVMGQAGVGHQGYFDTTPHPRAGRPATRTRVGHGWDTEEGTAHEPVPSHGEIPAEVEAGVEDGMFLG